jgi:hypothetical protein
MLLARLTRGGRAAEPAAVHLAPELVVRGSTGPPHS